MVVGAGVKGLDCARTLELRGVQVTVLEAEDRVGGKIKTMRSSRTYGIFDVSITNAMPLSCHERGRPARNVLDEFQAPFPPAGAHRLLLIALTAGIE